MSPTPTRHLIVPRKLGGYGVVLLPLTTLDYEEDEIQDTYNTITDCVMAWSKDFGPNGFEVHPSIAGNR